MTIYCEDTVVSPGIPLLTNVRIEFNIDGEKQSLGFKIPLKITLKSQKIYDFL